MDDLSRKLLVCRCVQRLIACGLAALKADGCLHRQHTHPENPLFRTEDGALALQV